MYKYILSLDFSKKNIEVQFVYNVVLISGAHKSDSVLSSVINVYLFFFRFSSPFSKLSFPNLNCFISFLSSVYFRLCNSY